MNPNLLIRPMKKSVKMKIHTVFEKLEILLSYILSVISLYDLSRTPLIVVRKDDRLATGAHSLFESPLLHLNRYSASPLAPYLNTKKMTKPSLLKNLLMELLKGSPLFY